MTRLPQKIGRARPSLGRSATIAIGRASLSFGRSLPLACLLLLLCAGYAQSAPPRPRPYSGCGVLALGAQPGGEARPLIFYREPGVARLAELNASALPRLAGSAPEPLLAVSEARGGWLLLAYDDAGREGWIEQARASRYLSWREFLPGRMLRVLPGMKKGGYALKSEPREGSADRASLTRDQAVRVLQVEDDWVQLQAPAGWFRWRDADGRLTVSLPGEGGG